MNILLLIKMRKSMPSKSQCAMNITKEQQKKNSFKPGYIKGPEIEGW